MNTMTARDVHLIGRCGTKGCKTAARISAHPIKVGTDRFGNPRASLAITVDKRYARRDPETDVPNPTVYGWDVRRSQEVDLFGHYTGSTYYLPMCVEHRRTLRFKPVNGTVNESKRCDGRCEAAVGTVCECWCGGANHGAAYGA